MADGPRCKRRKQANPRRTNVSNYSHVLEGQSDSDDEDKLHIVEEEGSLLDGADCDSVAPDDDPNGTVDPDSRWDDVKEECVSDEDERSRDALVEEMLQQGDTAVIFPEAPEDEPRQSTPETSGHDENGTPDSFSQLLTCPYCSRGYKRYTSLKEHIKYRHEKSEDNFSCSLCSYTFAYRTQLDRHMTAHKAGREQRHVTQSGGGGNRKFKCTECGKAFKYKHHLKEHLRIHSGEDYLKYATVVYVGYIFVCVCVCVCVCVFASMHMCVHSFTLYKFVEQFSIQYVFNLLEIYQPVTMVSSTVKAICGAAAVQAVVLPTVGLVSPISINLGDLQNVLKVAVDGNVIRQVLESAQAKGQQTGTGIVGAGGVGIAQAPQQVIQAISLPILDQDGSAKIFINYSLDPSQAQVVLQSPKKESLGLNTEACKAQKLPEDLTVKTNRDKTTITVDEKSILHNDTTLKHCGKDGHRINGKNLEGKIDLEEGLCPGQPPLKNLLSLLKAYFALNNEPTKEELAKISESVSLPAEVVKKWFEKMQMGQISVDPSLPLGEDEQTTPGDLDGTRGASPRPEPDKQLISEKQGERECCSPAEGVAAGENGIESVPTSPSPLNLSADGPVPARTLEEGEGPLDLSLPKSAATAAVASSHVNTVYSAQEEPLNLTCTKELLSNASTNAAIYASQPSANPINIVTTQLPTLVAITDQGQAQCLRALTTTNQTILIPQLTYSYTTTSSSPAGNDIPQKNVIHVNGIKEEKQEIGSEVTSTLEEQTDSDSGPTRKKMKRTESGLYACDLCDKIFQKSSSLLRHKYEHTGKRPHECGICSKAFKHKHHLIEHQRLHSGEKPYQCDKCGKRFSHSGSYSQHMNHRYSYCKKEAQGQGLGQGVEEEDNPGEEQPQTGSTATSPPSHLDSDERGSSTREDESEEDDEMGSGSLVDEDEIQVVKIGDEGDEDDQGADQDQEGERMEGAEQEDGEEEGESEENDRQTLKVVVMQDECEDENGEEEQSAQEAMDTGTLEHMKDTTEKESPADDERRIENEENTATMNGDVK
uniref:Zinc finger E-box-binding homeobox 1 n=1 Tax=Cyprinus carpio TaxID=7962 RepID=A0A8C2DH26_CYPCA